MRIIYEIQKKYYKVDLFLTRLHEIKYLLFEQNWLGVDRLVYYIMCITYIIYNSSK